MITCESAQDILDADGARRNCGKGALLTGEGRRVLKHIVKIMQPIPQAEIDAIIRGTLVHLPETTPT